MEKIVFLTKIKSKYLQTTMSIVIPGGKLILML